jgi:hypothetical protein
MKLIPQHFLFLSFALISNAQAATIFEIQSGVTIFADSVIEKRGAYYDQTFSDIDLQPITKSELTTAVTSNDLTTYAWTPNAHLPSQVLPDAEAVTNPYIDLGFNNDIYNGDGYDLVLFFAGNSTTFKDGHYEDFLFSVDVGADGSIEGGLLGTTDSTSYYKQDGDLYNLPSGMTSDTITVNDKEALGIEMFASYALIDLDEYGFDHSTPLGDIRLHLGDSSMPALAAVGAYHVTAVPLPLPVVLFASGLSLLGWVGRRKRR